MSPCASAGRCWLCRWVFPPPPLVAQRCDYRCSCADGVGRVSLECLSSERDAVVPEGAWPSRRARALAAALTLFFKVTSEGGAFRRMCGSLIKCCRLPRLMGQIAHYAGLYIMSNCLLLSLPANEPSSYTPGSKTKIWTVSLQQEGLEASGILWFRSSLCNFSFVAHNSDDTPSILGIKVLQLLFSRCASPASFTKVPSKFKVPFNSIPGFRPSPLVSSSTQLLWITSVLNPLMWKWPAVVPGGWGVVGTSAANLVSSSSPACSNDPGSEPSSLAANNIISPSCCSQWLQQMRVQWQRLADAARSNYSSIFTNYNSKCKSFDWNCCHRGILLCWNTQPMCGEWIHLPSTLLDVSLYIGEHGK